jgi:phage terminase small subunit
MGPLGDPEQPLRNEKHERYAQLLASGMSNKEAYPAAGYKYDRFNASRLHKHLRPRIEAIQRQQYAAQTAAMAQASAEPWLTRDYVLASLKENAERAMQASPVLDAKGQPTGEYRWDGSVANRSLELLGKELGMFAERRVVDQHITTVEQQSEADKILADSAAKLRALRATSEASTQAQQTPTPDQPPDLDTRH